MRQFPCADSVPEKKFKMWRQFVIQTSSFFKKLCIDMT